MSNLYSVFSSLIMELEKLGYLPKPRGLVIEEEIARGPYCTVHRGTLDGKPVAVKRMQKIFLETGHSFMNQLKYLMQAHNLLPSDHPGIVKCFGMYYDKQTGEPMLVMELMKENMWDYLEGVRGHLSVVGQCTMCRDIASALVYLHQQDPPITCCNLYGGNILISFDGQVKLGARGEAQQKPPGGNSDERLQVSPMYMPPEALRDACYNEKIDVFSLGVIMTEIATQRPPSVGFENIGIAKEIERPQSDLSRIPEDHPLKPIILQCLQDSPADRPNSASVLKELKKICPVSQRKYHSKHLFIQNCLCTSCRLPIYTCSSYTPSPTYRGVDRGLPRSTREARFSVSGSDQMSFHRSTSSGEVLIETPSSPQRIQSSEDQYSCDGSSRCCQGYL